MRNITPITLIGALFLSACSAPNVVVDPSSIKDTETYMKDLKNCEFISEQYDLTETTLGSGTLGAGVAVGTTAAILATGGLYLLPAGVALAAGGGAGVGAGLSKNKEKKARETIIAACLAERGYKAYPPS